MNRDQVEFSVNVQNLAEADEELGTQLLHYAAGLTKDIEYSTYAKPMVTDDAGRVRLWEVTCVADLERHDG